MKQSYQLQVVFERAQKHTTFQNWNVDFVHWLKTLSLPTTPKIGIYILSGREAISSEYLTYIQFGQLFMNKADFDGKIIVGNGEIRDGWHA